MLAFENSVAKLGKVCSKLPSSKSLKESNNNKSFNNENDRFLENFQSISDVYTTRQELDEKVQVYVSVLLDQLEKQVEDEMGVKNHHGSDGLVLSELLLKKKELEVGLENLKQEEFGKIVTKEENDIAELEDRLSCLESKCREQSQVRKKTEKKHYQILCEERDQFERQADLLERFETPKSNGDDPEKSVEEELLDALEELTNRSVEARKQLSKIEKVHHDTIKRNKDLQQLLLKN